MRIRTVARKVRDSSADALRRLLLRGSLGRLERVLRSGGQPDALLVRQLSHGWGNEFWSASPPLLTATFEWFARTSGPVVECGSGLTTLTLAAAASVAGRHVLSLEHDNFWAARARQALPAGLRPAVTIATVPIRRYANYDWYALEGCALPESIGFVLCDGPPGSTRGGRYGLGPVLGSHLAPGCIVLCDDTQRPEEHSIVQRWCSELGAHIIHEAGTFTVLRIGPDDSTRTAVATAARAVSRTPVQDGELRIIALAPNDWDGIWMNRQHLLSRLAARFPVLYSTGARSTWDREFLALGRGGVFGGFRARDAVVIDDPPHLPFRIPGVAALDRVAIRMTARRWHRRLRRFGRAPLVAYMFHPDYEVFLDALQPDYLVYHCYDLLSRTPSWNAATETRQARLLRRADLVVASSRVIADYLRAQFGGQVCIVPNGVDFEAFSQPGALPEPSDLRAVPRPRIAHVGRLNPKVDIKLMIALARSFPQWSFALIGPVVDLDADHAALYETARQIPNLHLLGAKGRDELPRYLHALDVGLLAYRTGVLWTEGIYPLKLHEYLATGLPIVSADIPAVREFPELVRIAATIDEWGACIQAALIDTAPARRALRVETARANSWEQRAASVEGLLRHMAAQPACGRQPG